MKNSSILFVTSDRYPFDGACSNIIKNLNSQFDTISNISTSILFLTDDYYDNDFGNEFKVFSWTLISKKKLIALFKKNPIIGLYGYLKKVIIKLFDKRFYSRYTSNILFRKLKKIYFKYDYIFFISGRFDTADVLYRIKKLDEKVKLIFFQVDPFVKNVLFEKYNNLKKELFIKRVYDSSFIIIKPSYLFDDYLYNSKKVIKLELPLLNSINNASCSLKHKSSSRKRCLFIGNIYGDIRNPDYCLKLLSMINDIEFHLVGVDDYYYKNDNIFYDGKKSLFEMQNELSSADFLVNIGNRTTNQLPSKILDYISTGKPIINFCKSINCPTITLLKLYDNCINIIEEESIFLENLGSVNSFIDNNYGKVLKLELIEDKLINYTPKHFMNELCKLLFLDDNY